jgi:importin subunit beta-1
VTKAAVAALGDLADALGGSIKPLLANSSFYNDLLVECLKSDDDTLKETAGWTQSLIQHILQS